MQSSLCISVTFLLGRFHGRTAGDRVAEWPPSPLRLFQALVAVAHRRRGEVMLPNEEEAALRWLESLSEGRPPLIIAAESRQRRPYIISVPNNDLDKWAKVIAAGREPNKQPSELRTMKTVRPTAVLHSPDNPVADATVHFVWPLDGEQTASARESCEVICQLVRRMVALGWGLDLVAAYARVLGAKEVAELRGVRWRPTKSSGGSLSDRPLPTSGTFKALRVRHGRWLGRVSLQDKHYDHIRPYIELAEDEAPRLLRAYVSESAVALRPFAAFAIRWTDNPEKSRAFGFEDAAKVAAMLRHAACEQAKRDWPFAENSARYVAGHGDRNKNRSATDDYPRFSYLAVPSITGSHPDGMIRRVLIAEPFGGDGSHSEWAAMTLHGKPLVDEDAGRPVATLDRIGDWTRDKVIPIFISGRDGADSREWITATPMVLPGFDGVKSTQRVREPGSDSGERIVRVLKPEMNKARKLFSRACDQAGLPPGSVESFESVGPPSWCGAAGRPFVPNYLRSWPLRHVRVVFREPIRGPIALGAGRHCGLGILAADG